MMTETKKITKREVINELLKEDLIQNTPMYKDYLEHELELLDRKNSSAKTSNTEENQEIAKILLEEMEKLESTGKQSYTITELMKSSDIIQNYICESGRPLSNPKITSIFRDMLEKENSPIVNIKDKKNSFYSLAK